MKTEPHNVKIIAHRGGRDWAPENTLAAFRQSLDIRVDGIELDVQRCSTGELVVFHDEDLSRTTNGVGLVAHSSLDEIKRLSAGRWFDRSYADEKVPLLQEVLDLVDGKCVLHIEIKNTPIEYEGIEEELLELLSGYSHRDKVVVSSFDHPLLARLHALDPALDLGLLVDGILIDLPAYAARIGCKYFHPCISESRTDTIEAAIAAGMRVNSWTVNGLREWRMAMDMGIEGIMTDDPLGFAEALGRVQVSHAD